MANRCSLATRLSKHARVRLLAHLCSDGASDRRLVTLCSAANFINAADRVLMPICIIELALEHGYSLHEQAYILSAFPAGYISSQVCRRFLRPGAHAHRLSARALAPKWADDGCSPPLYSCGR
jgi:hypothetical protein